MKRALEIVAAVLGLAVMAFFAAHSLRAIRFPFPLDYAEGPLLEQARLLASGQNIYRPNVSDYPFTVSNYPPVFPALVAVFGKVFGFGYGMARVVVFVAASACAYIASAITNFYTRDRLAAWITAATFLASPYAVFWSSLVRIDFVALAFSLGAVLVILRKPDATKSAVVAAVLVTLAVLTRQSHLLAGPLAITGALAVRNWRRALVFGAVLVALLAASVGGLQALTHGGFLFHTVRANVNPFSRALLEYFFSDLAAAYAPLLAFAIALAVIAVRQRRDGSILLGLYLLGTLGSAITIGKVGSHVNYFLEIAAALAVFAGVAFAFARRLDSPLGSRVLSLLLFAQIAWLDGRSIFLPDPLEGKLHMRDQFVELERTLELDPGPILADETMGVLVLAHHPILVQPFEFTQLVHQGTWDESLVLHDIKTQRFSLILVNDGPATPAAWTRERWTEAMLAAIHSAYEPTGGIAEATLYRPRRAP